MGAIILGGESGQSVVATLLWCRSSLQAHSPGVSRLSLMETSRSTMCSTPFAVTDGLCEPSAPHPEHATIPAFLGTGSPPVFLDLDYHDRR